MTYVILAIIAFIIISFLVHRHFTDSTKTVTISPSEVITLNREEWLEASLVLNAAEIAEVTEKLQFLEIDRADLVYLQENRGVHGFGNTIIPEESRHSSLPPVEGITERKRPWN